jgi:hypothetical protein
MCASRWLSHEIAWDYSTQKGAAGPWGRAGQTLLDQWLG